MLRACYVTGKKLAPSFLLQRWEQIEKSAAGARLARGVFWSGAGAVASRLLALAAAVVAAHLLGKTIFGELGIIQSTLSMFATFATFGVGLTATKHIAEYRVSDPERAGRIIAMSNVLGLISGVAIGLLMVLTAPFVAARFLGAPHLAPLIAATALALVFAVLNEAQIGALSGLEAFRRRSSIQAIGGIAAFPITLVAVYFFGLSGAVFALVIGTGILVVLNAYGIHKEAALAGIPISLKGVTREMSVIWRFNVPTLCCGAVYVPSMWMANMILVNGANGYPQMGLFSAADRWRTAIMFLPTLLGGVALPMLSSISIEKGSAHFRKMLRTNVAISVGASLAVALPIALLAPWIMAGFGPGFADGKWVLVLLCSAAVAHAGYWIIGQALVSRGRVWTMFALNLTWAVILLGSVWLLRHRGAAGLAAGYLFADMVRFGAGVVLCHRMLGNVNPLNAPPQALESPTEELL